MGKGGNGSASIVLIFAVLCLTIFTLISYMSALADQNLIKVELRLLKAYYEADTLAEQLLFEFFETDSFTEKIYLTINISETTELYVAAARFEGSYEILSWQTQAIGEWENDNSLRVWTE